MIWINEQIAVSGEEISEDNWAAFSTELGITAVVNLRSEYQDLFSPPLPAAYLWLPVTDFTDPALEQLLTGAQFIGSAVRSGGKVLVHCKLGVGRSPTLAAAYLVWAGHSTDEAIRILTETPGGRFQPIINRETLQLFASFLKEETSGR